MSALTICCARAELDRVSLFDSDDLRPRSVDRLMVTSKGREHKAK
jgi:hypothetical protein